MQRDSHREILAYPRSWLDKNEIAEAGDLLIRGQTRVMAGKLKLSVVIPLYNEEDCVVPLSTSLIGTCDRLGFLYELVFVDDGSRDQTFRRLKSLCQKDPKVKVIRLRRNFGQTAAMAAGFEYARGEVIISMDGDLQNDPADIPRLLLKMTEGFDVVCGWRKYRQDKFWTRRLPSVVANCIIGWVTGIRIHDNGCSLKAYRAAVIKNVPLYGEMHRFIPAMTMLVGARIAELLVNHHPRRFGKSKYGIGRIWRVALDIITVKMVTSFASRPALWFGLPSFPFIILGVFALLVGEGAYPGGFAEEWMVTETVGFLFLFLAAHLLTIGIVGELSMKKGDYRPTKSLLATVRVL